MYSKARVAGHPIHPMLVAFPIAFYTATVAMLLAYIGTLEAFWYRVAMVAAIAGIVTALVAVVPGAIDLFALPRGARARATGLRHAGFNLLATGLYAIAAAVMVYGWRHRVMLDGEYVFDATIPLAISVIAWVSMVIAGSLGWTLVQTHHVGIKPAKIRADRPSREPELQTLERPVIDDGVVDSGGAIDGDALPRPQLARDPLDEHLPFRTQPGVPRAPTLH